MVKERFWNTGFICDEDFSYPFWANLVKITKLN